MATAPNIDAATAAAIRQAMAALAQGNATEARAIGERALAGGGDPLALNAMLGTLALRSGDFPTATRHLQIAHERRPTDLTIALNLATALVQTGAFAEALEVASEERAGADAGGGLKRVRAFALQSSGDFSRAADAYQQIVAASPDDWESWNNLGNSRLAAGQEEAAVEALRRAAELAPDAAPVRLNLANALAAAGQPEQAEAELGAMMRDFPDDPHPCRELYVLMRSQAREEQALEAIEEASRRSPDDIELLLAVASQRLLLLDNNAAERAYNEVIAREPANPIANVGLAITYELGNRTAELSVLPEAAKARGADVNTVNLITAYALRRQRRFEEGLAALSGVSSDLQPERQAHLRGQLAEGAGHYAEAWAQYSLMNELQRADPSQPELRAQRYREVIRTNYEATTPQWADGWTADDGGSPGPVFLVGFPRSGTTLLDTMLLGHPDVVVLEEESTLTRASALFQDYENLPLAPADAVQRAREAYLEDAAKLSGADLSGKLLVDKNPLMIAAAPLIYRIFPNARIILALRDPRDVLFSCFTTNFKLNDAMSNFLTLETSAELYELVFSYFERARGLLPIAVHQIAYEDVVADPEANLRALVNFLELPWSDEVLDHQRTAAKRGRVKTASYAQIAEPLYTRSSGRSVHFRPWLEPVLPVLEPWMEKFGYGAE